MEGSRISWGPRGLGLLRLSRNSRRKVRAGPSGFFREGNATKHGQSHALKFSWLQIFNNKKGNGLGVFTSIPLPLPQSAKEAMTENLSTFSVTCSAITHRTQPRAANTSYSGGCTSGIICWIFCVPGLFHV